MRYSNSREVASDFHVRNHGSIWLLAPVTKAAKVFIDDNVDAQQWFAGSVVIEWRYVETIIRAIDDAGLSIS